MIDFFFRVKTNKGKIYDLCGDGERCCFIPLKDMNFSFLPDQGNFLAARRSSNGRLDN